MLGSIDKCGLKRTPPITPHGAKTTQNTLERIVGNGDHKIQIMLGTTQKNGAANTLNIIRNTEKRSDRN